MALDETVRSRIADLVAAHRVVLFMKGTREAPQCGFSAQVVQILDELLPSYETVDALRSPELREGIKEFSQWPTIPQLYVDGKFVGGCDIVRDMSASGELQKLLGARGAEAAAGVAPAIDVSEAATKAFESALADSPGEWLRLKIEPSFQHELFVGPREPGDVEARSKGLTFLLDAPSARRASGLSIDFVPGANGGFKMTNPNEPPRVKPLSAPELKAMLNRGEVVLFDVRPEGERARASIAAARPLDAAGQEHLRKLARDTAIALHCHHGVRSQQAAEKLLGEGFRRVFNLNGGIDEWSRTVESVGAPLLSEKRAAGAGDVGGRGPRQSRGPRSFQPTPKKARGRSVIEPRASSPLASSWVRCPWPSRASLRTPWPSPAPACRPP